MVDPGGCVVVGPEGASNIHVCMCVYVIGMNTKICLVS